MLQKRHIGDIHIIMEVIAMDMGRKIEMLRKEKGMTLEELGDKVGVGKSTVRKWENGMIANMRRDKIAKIASALGISPANLMGWPEEEYAPEIILTKHETEHIKKYRIIDDRGRSNVDAILGQEYFWSQNHEYEADLVDYLYLGKVAAAGTEIYPGDIPLERIRERRLDGADFMVGVSGDSMEPTYFDGDKVYVKKTTDIEFGDIGLFIVNGCYYIKEYAPDGLRSHNPNYSLIPKSREIIVVGKVLGKAEK